MPDLALASWPRVDGRRSLLFVGFAVLTLFCLRGYINPFSLPAILGMVALPFTVHRATTERTPKRYLIAAACFLLLTALVPVKTILFFALGFSIFYLIEAHGFRVRLLSVSALVVMAPAFSYAANAFSFPIRLQLTAWVGRLFAALSAPVETAGNLISHGSTEFSVDPACMGLNMLVASLLLGIMLAGYYEGREKVVLRPQTVLLLLAFVVVFNVVSNLIRIFLIVQFLLLPDTLMHELAGIGCLLLYVVLPVTWLAKRLVRRARPRPQPVAASRPSAWLPLALGCSLALGCIRVDTVDTFDSFYGRENLTVAGYRTSLFAPGIIKLDNAGHLVYIKYLRGFYDTDHNPSLCWTGSGYSFSEMGIGQIGAHRYFTATITKGKERLYTAWWYGNCRCHTTDQWTWRWNMLRGERNYAVVNITAATPAALGAEVRNAIERHSFDIFFDRH
jgi:exosortase N